MISVCCELVRAFVNVYGHHYFSHCSRLVRQTLREFDVLNVFSERSRSLYAIARPLRLSSIVYNVRAPYSGGSHFPQYFYGIRYLGHPLTSTENFTEIVPGEPLRRGS